MSVINKLFFACLLLVSTSLLGQDIHFSQYYHSPLSNNPAMTANFNGIVRASAVYRTQWWKVASQNSFAPYVTYLGSVDGAFVRNQGFDRLGAGLLIYQDQAGDGALTTSSAYASLAYHKAVDRYQKSIISIGFQGGIVQKRIDVSGLFFETQLDGFGFDPGRDNGEIAFTGEPIRYADFNTGLLFQSELNETFSYYFGFGLFHMTAPRESFLNDDESRLDRRYNFHLGAEISFGDLGKFTPGILYMLQSNAQQINIGAAYNHIASPDLDFFGGVWSRINNSSNIDAVIVMGGFEYLSYRLGLSYDINISELSAVTRSQGSFEATFTYIYGEGKKGRPTNERYCPQF